jgi:hypothetical protein
MCFLTKCRCIAHLFGLLQMTVCQSIENLSQRPCANPFNTGPGSSQRPCAGPFQTSSALSHRPCAGPLKTYPILPQRPCAGPLKTCPGLFQRPCAGPLNTCLGLFQRPCAGARCAHIEPYGTARKCGARGTIFVHMIASRNLYFEDLGLPVLMRQTVCRSA